MKEFYEKDREENQNIYIARNNNHLFAAHFHLNLEVFISIKGEYDISIDGKRYSVKKGGIAVIDSYKIHSYNSTADSSENIDNIVVIFPYKYLRRFNERRSGKQICEPVFYDECLSAKLIEIAEKYLYGTEYQREAAADLFLCMLYENMSFSESKTYDDGSLARKILLYIQSNFREEITRKNIANALGYTESYISQIFHSFIGKGITRYINELRLNYIETLRNSGDTRKTTEIIYEAGFKSQQTYYRVKKSLSAKE